MSNEIKVASFKYTGNYFPQILRTLRQYRRTHVPEITSEDDHEPFEQCLRAYALASHISNVLADLIALESFLPTAQLLTSVRNHLRLINYELSLATPAQVTALLELTKVFTTASIIVPYKAQFSTQRTEATEEITFEYLANTSGLTIARTDQLGSCLTEERTDSNDPSTATFTTATDEANSISGSTITPWATPNINDAIYFGHGNVMCNRIDIGLDSNGSSVGIQNGVWEFYDGEYQDANPNTVINNGANLTFKINNFLGSQDKTGTLIRVTYLPTGAYEEVYSTFSNPDNTITTASLLAQTTTPSVVPEDYSVGSDWNPLPNVVDGTNNFQQSGAVTFDLPQTSALEWIKNSVNNISQYWVRYRITKVESPTANKPVIEYVKIDEGDQYTALLLTQGESVSDIPLGSSNGLADQEFILKRKTLIENSLEIKVGGVTWTQVDDFLSSNAQSKHYTVTIGDDDNATVKFGNGIYGAIPVLDINNINAYYRIGADENGNIASGALTENKSGLAYIASVINPKAGNGWKIKDGGSEADLERVKVAGPASLRALNRAVSIGDIEALAPNYTSATGSKPVARAYEIEGLYGSKTIGVVCVGQGGNFLTTEQIDEFQKYLNGDTTAVPPTRGIISANTQATVINYERRIMNIVATVYGGNQTEIENAISALLSPVKLKADGVTYQWDFGGEIPLSVIMDAIHNVSASVRKVTVTTPNSDTLLGIRELPYPGTISVTVVP